MPDACRYHTHAPHSHYTPVRTGGAWWHVPYNRSRPRTAGMDADAPPDSRWAFRLLIRVYTISRPRDACQTAVERGPWHVAARGTRCPRPSAVRRTRARGRVTGRSSLPGAGIRPECGPPSVEENGAAADALHVDVVKMRRRIKEESSHQGRRSPSCRKRVQRAARTRNTARLGEVECGFTRG